ncbi:MAG TPA: methionine--tRNA ligase [Gaiellaceae bacterium]|nr:methionine--tRNA ligase [Gaiellaceae bacterium]
MRYYVTTPIYYVNDVPHIGHAYTTIAADIAARHRRQRGEETFFLTGIDEHGTKVRRVAEAEGVSPQEYVDRISAAWRELSVRVDAEPDFFIRTSDPEHAEFVREFLQRIYDSGDVYEDIYAGLYCVGCEAFKLESELVDGKCPDHGDSVQYLEEKNYFFRLSAYQERLLQLYEERENWVLPGFRANEARSFVEGGLRDFSISRAGETWGIKLPWDESQVAYVWADALVNYLSALTYARPGEDLRADFWPVVHHLMAKDILRFHCVYWPAMLLSAGYEVPNQIFVHGYLLLERRKISKSLGNVISPLDLVDVYGTDAVRFWGIRSVSFGQDGSVSLDSIHERYERELGNELGNLLSRTTAMIARYRDGRVPSASGSETIRETLAPLGAAVATRMDSWDLTGALEAIWVVVRRLNAYVEETKPWELAGDEAHAGELDTVLHDLADGLRCLAIALAAFIPRSSAAILAALGQSADLDWASVAPGKTASADGIEPAAPLFPRIDAPAAA